MPPCNKELNIMTDMRSEKVALTVRCCQSEGHEGKHEWHLWTDGENKAQESGKGIVKVIR